MRIIIDGYNFIGRQKGLRGDLQEKRRLLIEELAVYRRIKGFSVTVVFDGSGRGGEERIGGVEVLFSGYGESADEVIGQLAEEFREGCTVVSSDRAVQEAVRRSGGVAIYAGEFEAKLHAALREETVSSPKGEKEEPEQINRMAEPLGKRGGDQKKGNPRKLPKSERRRGGRLKRL
ncbi:MAG: NYN domain-containing protein [Candidatus Manganitrophaceae bacterium]